jgi:hypothetical protein
VDVNFPLNSFESKPRSFNFRPYRQILKSALSNGSEQAVTLRRLKWLCAALVFSNLFVGGMSVYLLRSQDDNYTHLLEASVPLMNQVRATGRDGGLAFRGVIEAFVADDRLTTEAAVARARDAMKREDDERAQIEKAPMLANQPALIDQLEKAATEFERDATTLLTRVKAESTADAERVPIRHLSESQDRYGAAIQKVADFVESKAESISGGYTASTRSRSAFVLGLAGWPVLVAGLVVALTVAVVVVMLFVFRRADAGDGP